MGKGCSLSGEGSRDQSGVEVRGTPLSSLTELCSIMELEMAVCRNASVCTHEPQ